MTGSLSGLVVANFEPYVMIDGVRAPMHKQDVLAGQPTIMDGLSFPWGRNTIVDQPDASSASFTIRQRTGFDGVPSLFTYCHAGATVQIWATGVPALGVPDRLVWAGEIATAKIQPTDPYAIEAAITCVDPSATLGNIDIGDEDWPEETAYARFQRMLSAAGVKIRDLRPTAIPGPDWRWNLTGDMDETIQNPRIAYRPANPQPALGLIQDLAKSVGGIAWVTADDLGPSIWLEDPTQRKGLRQFMIDPTTGQVTVGQLSLDLGGVNEWKRSEIVPADPAWTQDPSQSINVINVAWQQRTGTDDAGNPAYMDATIAVADSDSDKGIRAFDVPTDLVDDADARRLAIHWMGQAQTGDWIVDGLAVDATRVTRAAIVAEQFIRVLDLLDVRTRIGQRITVTELPDWAPTGPQQSYYIEGGNYTWSGRWQLQLTASANAIGGGARFSDFPPGVKVSDFTGLKGRDAWGAAPPNLSAPVVPFTIPVMI